MLLKTKLKSYESVYNEFRKFFDDDELTLILKRKADIYMVDQLDDLKANKLQVSQLLTKIENLNDRVKHVSVIQNEIADQL